MEKIEERYYIQRFKDFYYLHQVGNDTKWRMSYDDATDFGSSVKARIAAEKQSTPCHVIEVKVITTLKAL